MWIREREGKSQKMGRWGDSGLDDTVESIEPGENKVTIRWRDGETSVVEMNVSEERYNPTRYSDFYNDFLDRIRRGEKRNKYKHLMGLAAV